MTDTPNSKRLARSSEDLAAQKRRNMWLALALAAFVVLVGVTSAIRIQGSDLGKSDGFYMSGALDNKASPSPDADKPDE